jgi:protein tyrosine/serine phosphatase
MRVSFLALFLLLTSCLPFSAGAGLHITEVAPGIYRGKAPSSARDYEELENLGIKTVLDLRNFLHHYPILREGEELQTRGIVHKIIALSFDPEKDQTVDQAFRELTDPSNYPLYIHCQLNHDRTSLLIGLYRVRCQGWSLEAAHREMEEYGMMCHLFRHLDQYFWKRAQLEVGRPMDLPEAGDPVPEVFPKEK